MNSEQKVFARALNDLYKALEALQKCPSADPDSLAVLREAIGLIENDEYYLSIEAEAEA